MDRRQEKEDGERRNGARKGIFHERYSLLSKGSSLSPELELDTAILSASLRAMPPKRKGRGRPKKRKAVDDEVPVDEVEARTQGDEREERVDELLSELDNEGRD